jgi:ribosomal protein S18 acetylase RimI-like enzyme
MSPSVTFTNRLESLREDQLEGFFVGWPEHPNPAAHLAILRGSHEAWLALDGVRCVGFINAISDGIFYAYIPLLEVLPRYQRMGIGSELVRRMLDTLRHMYAIDLVCDEVLAPFYTTKGFSRQVGMIVRNGANQRATSHS